MKQNRMNTWKKIRSVGKGYFIFLYCCVFYLGSIPVTLHNLWPEGKFVTFDDYLTDVIVVFIIGILTALIIWTLNERKFKKVSNIQNMAV